MGFGLITIAVHSASVYVHVKRRIVRSLHGLLVLLQGALAHANSAMDSCRSVTVCVDSTSISAPVMLLGIFCLETRNISSYMQHFSSDLFDAKIDGLTKT